MKKSIAIIGLFLMMISLTSFSAPNEIGGRNDPGKGTDSPTGQFNIVMSMEGRGIELPILQ